MTQKYNDLFDLLLQTQSEDFLSDVMKFSLQKLMDVDVSNHLKASLNEQTQTRQGYRNGYRSRNLNTRVGTLSLQIPKLRNGTYFPGFLNHYKRTEKALVSVIQEAYVQGVSTRKMEDLVQHLGVEGMSKSQVSELCTDIQSEVTSFLEAPICGEWPYVYLDAVYIKVRENKRVVSKAAVVAIGINSSGNRRILGFKMTESEAFVFWKEFLDTLVERGLTGVKLLISDAHNGLREAIEKTFLGASWQRCWVHFMRNVLSYVPKKNMAEIAGYFKSITAFKTAEERSKQWQHVMNLLKEKYPKIANLMQAAEADVLAHTHFPEEHWSKIYSNNPLERLNREIKRRTNSIGIFPNDLAATRLLGAVLIHWDEEWSQGRQYLKYDTIEMI